MNLRNTVDSPNVTLRLAAEILDPIDLRLAVCR